MPNQIRSIDIGNSQMCENNLIDLIGPNKQTEFDISLAKTIDYFKEQIDDNDISYNIDPISGRSVFDNVGSNDYSLAFNEDCAGELDMGTPLPLKLGWLLGFRAATYLLPQGGELYSEGIANFAVPKYLYICININSCIKPTINTTNLFI